MERVETLLQKLQQQFKNGLPAEQLLVTVQMLQHELTHIQANQPATASGAISVSMPLQVIQVQQPGKVEFDDKPVVEEKIIEVLQIDEDEVAAELEEMKRNAITMQQIRGYNKPHLLFEPEENDIPTLTHQVAGKESKEVNEIAGAEATSVNDSLKEKKIEISEKLTGLPVKDLKKAIGINDRFLYINDLFRGDEVMYERSIKTINSFSIWPEAEYWIRRELKTKLGWTDDNETVKQFDQLIKRRFS
ncbi:MAG: hypothetical protein ABIQ31_24170 [Ferruginibacter sp.]